MLRILLTRRVLGFTALVAALLPAFVLLGLWQWDRFEERRAATLLQDANQAAEAVPYPELAEVGGDVAPEDRWHATVVTGTYDPEHELLVRNRTSDHGVGFHVVTPLVTDDGTAVLVNRGWVERAADATATPDVPEVPSGEVTVTGRAQVSETEERTGIRDRGGLPASQVMNVNVPAIATDLPYPVYGGFVELVEQDPASDPAPVPVTVDGYNYGLNAAYAVQWWCFAAIAVGGLVVLVRRELRAAPATTPGDPEDSPTPVPARG